MPAVAVMPVVCRMSLMIRRAPVEIYMDEAHQADMELIDQCLDCGQCKSKCPYGLDTPNLLKKNLVDYREQVAIHKNSK